MCTFSLVVICYNVLLPHVISHMQAIKLKYVIFDNVAIFDNQNLKLV